MSKTPTRIVKTFKYAVYFDGVDDYAVVNHHDSLNIQPGNKITIMMWFIPTGWQVGVIGGVVLNKLVDLQAGYSLEFESRNFFVRLDGGGRATWTPMPHPFATLNHYTAVVDGTVLSMYLNGVLGVQGSDMPTSGENTANLIIGRFKTPSGWTRGYIHAVYIYSRPLTAEEVSWNYKYPDNPVKNGLVLWLQADPNNIKDVDGDGVLEWVDLSGFGNHGKMYGATLVGVVKSPARVLPPVR